MVALFPHVSSAEVAAKLGLRIGQVSTRAKRMGLKKSAAYLASPAAGRLSRENAHARGATTRFKPGNPSHNKGLRRPGYSVGRGRMQETTFKRGQLPHNTVPIGAEAVRDGDLVWVKVRDDLKPARLNWQPKQRVVWEAANGPIPPGHMVVFRDGNRRNFAIENLECYSKAEHQARHSIHAYGPEIAHISQLRGAITRQVNKIRPPAPKRRGRPPKTERVAA